MKCEHVQAPSADRRGRVTQGFQLLASCSAALGCVAKLCILYLFRAICSSVWHAGMPR